MTNNAEIEGNNSKTQDSNINNFLNNIPTKYNSIGDYPENSNGKINGKNNHISPEIDMQDILEFMNNNV